MHVLGFNLRRAISLQGADELMIVIRKWPRRKHGISLDAIVPFSFGELMLLCPASLQKRESLKELAPGRCMVAKRDTVFRLPSLVGV